MDTVEYFPVPAALAPLKLPFSEAVRVGSMLYLSGAIGIDDTGTIVPGGIEAETRQALANIRVVLERHGSSMDRVIKCTVMLTDMREWAAMNRVYPAVLALARGRLPSALRVSASASAIPRGGDRGRLDG